MSSNNGLSDLPRHEVRRLVSQEALGRIDEHDRKYAFLVEKNNRQAAALEAIANAITGYALDQQRLQQRLDVLECPYWRRMVLSAGLILRTVSQRCDRFLGKTTITRFPDRTH